MEKKIVKVDAKEIEYLEALYCEYNAKKDIIDSIFELHQFDESDGILKSKPFKAYEKEFAEVKVKYDTVMKEVQGKFVPVEYQEHGCRWEVDFEANEIVVTPM